MIYLLILLGSLLLGISLIGVGIYVWLAAKKVTLGVILIVVGLAFILAPLVIFGFFTIASSTRG
jgi:hypothetical protein